MTTQTIESTTQESTTIEPTIPTAQTTEEPTAQTTIEAWDRMDLIHELVVWSCAWSNLDSSKIVDICHPLGTANSVVVVVRELFETLCGAGFTLSEEYEICARLHEYQKSGASADQLVDFLDIQLGRPSRLVKKYSTTFDFTTDFAKRFAFLQTTEETTTQENTAQTIEPTAQTTTKPTAQTFEKDIYEILDKTAFAFMCNPNESRASREAYNTVETALLACIKPTAQTTTTLPEENTAQTTTKPTTNHHKPTEGRQPYQPSRRQHNRAHTAARVIGKGIIAIPVLIITWIAWFIQLFTKN
jgi:hypothetical protein